ncbi:hypothetical protein [Bacteroides heparinolyticus]|uniref:hypothetical protein n=1 Tax=Prevotella heparinolytica TaxID=28113 RepID=UPI0035A0EE1E
MERIGKDAPTGLDDKIEKGIDGIYKNNTPPPKYVIDEAKYNSSQLNQKTKSGPQMSDDWIENRIKKQCDDGLLTEAERDDILDALQNGEVDKVVSHVDEAGNVTTYKVDVDANGNTSYGKTSWP